MNARPVVRRFVLVSLLLPATIVALAVVAQLVALPYLPDPVAIHWGASGAPDGFAPAWASVVITAVVGLGLPALLAATVLPPLRRGEHGGTYRLLGATALGIAVLMSVLGTATLLMQIGVTDAAEGPKVFAALTGAFAAALAAAVGGWLLQPHDPWSAASPDPTDPLPLAEDERAVWLRRTLIAVPGVIVMMFAIVVLAATTIGAALLSSEPGPVWILAGATVLVVALVATTVAFDVRVDVAGLTVTSAVGWPRVRVPVEDVVEAAVVAVHPMAEFGGWGLRWAPTGRFGVVLRTGPGIEVRRRSGKTFTVTVDDAETGAALLNALRERTGGDVTAH